MRVVFLSLLVTLAGCTVGPNFVPPKPPAVTWHDPSAQRNATVTPASNPDPLWWQEFHDPVLTGLIEQAIAGDPTLQESLLRVVEAHQNEAATAAQGLPHLDANTSYMREQLGLKSYSEALQAPAAFNSFGPPEGPVLNRLLNELEAPSPMWQYGLSSSWEFDLFGKVRRSVEQAKANADAQAEATNDALVMLESQVGQAYLQLRAAQALVQTQASNIDAAQQSLNLTVQRQLLGLTAQLDVDQARTQLYAYQAQLPAYQKQVQQAINELDMLLGRTPGALDAALAAPAPLPKLPPLVGIGLPSTLARRRPDIRQAEAQLHAATANVGVVVASFYPDISLTGSIGHRALDAGLLTSWASIFYAAGPTITLPIFEGGKLTADLRLAHAQQAEAALNYRATVLNALREVEDALVAYRTDAAAADREAATAQAATTSLGLAKTRYSLGLSSFLDVLESERTLVSATQQAVQADATVALDLVTLYTALGGGWQLSPTSLPATPVTAPLPILPAAADSLAVGPVH